VNKSELIDAIAPALEDLRTGMFDPAEAGSFMLVHPATGPIGPEGLEQKIAMVEMWFREGGGRNLVRFVLERAAEAMKCPECPSFREQDVEELIGWCAEHGEEWR
jgi:hypothetical protein